MKSSPITLYGCLICPYVQRARIALDELNVEANYEEVDLLRSEQFSEWYKAINPLSKVPALQFEDKRIVCESLAIVEYINDAYGT
jgi:glutathione S-transferase